MMPPSEGVRIGYSFAGLPLLGILVTVSGLGITYALSISLGRFQGNGVQVARFPWPTDTFELHPEAGVAVTLIGGAGFVLSFTLFLWHCRCQQVLLERKQQGRLAPPGLVHSRWVAATAGVSAAATLATMGFKTGGWGGVTPWFGAACGYLMMGSIAASLGGVAVIDHRSGQASTTMTITRCCIFCTAFSCQVASIVVLWGSECRTSHTTDAGPVLGGGTCLSSLLNTKCGGEVLSSSGWCSLPPILHLVFLVSIFSVYLTTAACLWRCRFDVLVWDDGVGGDEWGAGGQLLADSGKDRPAVGARAAEYRVTLMQGSYTNGNGGGKDTGRAGEEADAGGAKGGYEQAYATLGSMRESKMLPDNLVATIEGILFTLEEDAKTPDEDVLSGRLHKLFLSVRSLALTSSTPLPASYANLSRKARKTLKDGAGEDFLRVSRRSHHDPTSPPGRSNMRGLTPGNERTPRPAWEMMGLSARASDRWRDASVPCPADLSEFDPVSPAVTAEQRKRLLAAKRGKKNMESRILGGLGQGQGQGQGRGQGQGQGQGQPRSAQEAWEAHMKTMAVAPDAPEREAGAGEAPQGGAMMGGPRLAAKLDKK